MLVLEVIINNPEATSKQRLPDTPQYTLYIIFYIFRQTLYISPKYLGHAATFYPQWLLQGCLRVTTEVGKSQHN